MSTGVVVNLAESLIAELFVKGKRLKRERVEPDSRAAALPRDVFSLVHQVCAQALAAELVGNDQVVNEEPIIGAAAA